MALGWLLPFSEPLRRRPWFNQYPQPDLVGANPPATKSNGYFLHYTGVLIPLDQHVSAFYATSAWAVNVPTPVPNPIYEASPSPFDIGSDASARISLTVAGFLLPEASGAATFQGQIDYWRSAGVDPVSWQNWSVAQATFRFLRARVMQNTAAGVAALSMFNVTVDNAPAITDQSAIGAPVAVAPGGTTITMNKTFHIPPNVQAQVIGTSALYAVVSNATITTFLVHIFDFNGNDVGGNITWQASGE